MRRKPVKTQRERLYGRNAKMCCVCKAAGVGLELHHIDGDAANTVDGNLAVLCVGDHDAHHRPAQYTIRHTELSADRIRQYKTDWEAFVAEARLPAPRVFVTVAGYGSQEALHSAKAVYQWTNGRIEFERLYHLHSGTIDDELCANLGDGALMG